jgi:[acyl-carrier-protein] S-malonyltransferase
MKKIAFVFPGQGSQSVGMLDAWADHPAVRDTLAQANDALGEDLAQVIAQGPKETLDLTTTTQPAMLVAGVAVWRAWVADTGIEPVCVAGHSLGEYTALVAAGSLTLADAVPLVRLRAQAMQEAVPVGAGGMAAILGLEAARVRDVCSQVTQQVGEVVEAVNFNDPMQTVIAGTKAAVDAACVAMKEAGAKRALVLAVSAPFHSSLMAPAAEKLKAKLATVNVHMPTMALINNVDVAEAVSPDGIRDALYRQAFGPVRWVETIQAFKARGVTHIIECGPGKALSGMVKRIDAELVSAAVGDPASLQAARELLA